MFRAALYARVSTNDQQTLAMRNRAIREYTARRGWTTALQVREVGSGAVKREARERLMEAARRREIDVVLVWRLDRWGRSVTDLLATLQELNHLGVGFVSLTEALDLTTPAGRAMAGLLAIFAELEREILRERTRAGLAQARQNGKRRAGRKRPPGMPLKSKNYTEPVSVNPKSPGVCRSAAPRYAASWEQSHEKTQARSCAGRPHSQRSDRRCSSGRAGNELVLLSGKQDNFPVPGKVCHRARCLAAPEW
jgi:putative DNA-invertase from lambdoid prophage Rac